jgi:hypothetical protein
MSSTSKRPRRKYTQRIVRDMVWVEGVGADESAVVREKRTIVNTTTKSNSTTL